MQDIDWNVVSAAIAAVLTGVGIWWQTVKGKKTASGVPPVDRPPSPHEIREAVSGIHEHLRKITRKLDTMDDSFRKLGSSDESILLETGKIRDVLRELENWQKLHDAKISLEQRR